MDPAVTARVGEAIAVRNLSTSYATRDGRVAALERITFIVKQPVEDRGLVTNELIDEINRFDASQVAAEANAYKPR